MQVTLHKLFKASTAGLKLVAMSLLMFVNVFFTRAQYNDTSVRLTFAFDSPVLSRNYMSNSSAMDQLDSLVARIADGESVNVVTFSSPEGNYAYNLQLSQKRAEAVRSYIASRYPALAGRITVNAGAESWDELRRSVMSDARLSSYARASVRDIVDSSKDADVKEAELKAIPAYKSLYSNYFRGLRYAEISLRIKNLTPVTPQHTNAGVSESKNDSASGQPVVYYYLSEDFIRPGYMNNGLNLKEIRRILSNPENRQKTIVIEGAASPEGPVSINTRLGIARAENLANWIIGQFPDVKVETRSKGEDWEGLAASIQNCESLEATDKQELLGIIGSNNTPARKEALMKAHPAYGTVETDCLPYIRYARIAGLEMPAQNAQEPAPAQPAHEPETQPVTEEPQEQEQPQEQEHVNEQAQAVESAEESANVEGQQGNIAGNGVTYRNIGKNMIVAAKTNLLYDAVTALNFEVEVPIGDRFSIMAEDVFPWWETGNKYCFQLWEMGVEARYWFKPWKTVGMEKLRGVFVGPYVMSAKYDFQFDKSINYQGEFWSAGITAGYSMPIGKKQKANLEFSISMGYMESPFRHYQPTDDYTKLIKDPANNGTFYNIFMYPTKAKVSLVVPIGIPTSKKEVSYE